MELEEDWPLKELARLPHPSLPLSSRAILQSARPSLAASELLRLIGICDLQICQPQTHFPPVRTQQENQLRWVSFQTVFFTTSYDIVGIGTHQSFSHLACPGPMWQPTCQIARQRASCLPLTKLLVNLSPFLLPILFPKFHGS